MWRMREKMYYRKTELSLALYEPAVPFNKCKTYSTMRHGCECCLHKCCQKIKKAFMLISIKHFFVNSETVIHKKKNYFINVRFNKLMTRLVLVESKHLGIQCPVKI